MIRVTNAVQLPRGFRVSVALPQPDEFAVSASFAQALRNFRASRGLPVAPIAEIPDTVAGEVAGTGSAGAGGPSSVSEAVVWGAGSAGAPTIAESFATAESVGTAEALPAIGEDTEMHAFA